MVDWWLIGGWLVQELPNKWWIMIQSNLFCRLNAGKKHTLRCPQTWLQNPWYSAEMGRSSMGDLSLTRLDSECFAWHGKANHLAPTSEPWRASLNIDIDARIQKTIVDVRRWTVGPWGGSIWQYHLVMTNIAMENPPIFKNGKPSINGHFPWLC